MLIKANGAIKPEYQLKCKKEVLTLLKTMLQLKEARSRWRRRRLRIKPTTFMELS